MQAREPPSTCVQPRRVLPDGDGVVAMQPGETGFSLADLQTLFSLMAASSIALIPSRAPLLPALWGQTGGVWPPAALVPPPPRDKEMHTHARLAGSSGHYHPSSSAIRPSSIHSSPPPQHFSGVCPPQLSVFINQSSSHSLVHPSICLPLPLHRSLHSIHLHASLGNPGVIALHSCLLP